MFHPVPSTMGVFKENKVTRHKATLLGIFWEPLLRIQYLECVSKWEHAFYIHSLQFLG